MLARVTNCTIYTDGSTVDIGIELSVEDGYNPDIADDLVRRLKETYLELVGEAAETTTIEEG